MAETWKNVENPWYNYRKIMEHIGTCRKIWENDRKNSGNSCWKDVASCKNYTDWHGAFGSIWRGFPSEALAHGVSLRCPTVG